MDSSQDVLEDILLRLKEYERSKAEHLEAFKRDMQRYHCEFSEDLVVRNASLQHEKKAIDDLNTTIEAVIKRTEKDLAILFSEGTTRSQKTLNRFRVGIDHLVTTRDKHAALALSKLEDAHKARMERLSAELTSQTNELHTQTEEKRALSIRVAALEEQVASVTLSLETARIARPAELQAVAQGILETEIACEETERQIALLETARTANADAERTEARLHLEISSLEDENRELQRSRRESATLRRHSEAAAAHARLLRTEVTNFQVPISRSALTRPKTAGERQDRELFKILERRGIELFPKRPISRN